MRASVTRYPATVSGAERAADAALQRDLRRWEERSEYGVCSGCGMTVLMELLGDGGYCSDCPPCGAPHPALRGVTCHLARGHGVESVGPEDHEGFAAPCTWQAPGPDGQPGLAVTGQRVRWEP